MGVGGQVEKSVNVNTYKQKVYYIQLSFTVFHCSIRHAETIAHLTLERTEKH